MSSFYLKWIHSNVPQGYMKSFQFLYFFYWYKTTQIYYLTTLEIRSPNESFWAKIQVLAGLHFFLEDLVDNLFYCLFQPLEDACIPWLLASSSIFKSKNKWRSLSHMMSSDLLFSLLNPLLRKLMITLALPKLSASSTNVKGILLESLLLFIFNMKYFRHLPKLSILSFFLFH